MESNRYVQFDPAVIEQARQIDLPSYPLPPFPSPLDKSNGSAAPHIPFGSRPVYPGTAVSAALLL